MFLGDKMLNKILIIDDDEKLRSLLASYLQSNGLEVLCADSGYKARQILNQETIDVIVLDVMMPKEDGFQVAERLSLQGEKVPIIFLTAAISPEDRIKGLELGAKDYLTKPFEPKELLLRLKNIINYSAQKVSSSPATSISFGSFVFNLKKKTLRKSGSLVSLTDLEKHLLFALTKYANSPLSREKLAQTNFGSISDRTIDVQVARLRRKIEEDPKKPMYIQTIRHKGYALITEPEE